MVRLAARVRGPRLRAALLVAADRKRRHLHEAARYILLNPVHAGMCATAPDWKWTSYRKTMGMSTKGPRLSRMLLYEFGRRLDIARKRFAAFIREAE
ncbi:MAG: hypothetical protein ACXVE1_14450 [Gaiellaceae bacterium]